MNIASAFSSLNLAAYHHAAAGQPKAAAQEKPRYHGTQQQADAVAQQDTMVRKHHRPLGHSLTQRQW